MKKETTNRATFSDSEPKMYLFVMEKCCSFVEKQRHNLVMKFLHLRWTVIFLQVFDVNCFDLGG